MKTLKEATDFITQTKQPLMYFTHEGNTYRFKSIQHNDKEFIYPYYCEENGKTCTISIRKGDIKQYLLSEEQRCKVKI